ncbi:MAG: DUF2637 domain-containing protein [Actinoallomurus sp.]
MTDSPAHYSTAQRRLLTAAGGLGVAALAGATFVLSYDDLRALAVQGGAARHRAFLYPGMVDGLVVVVILSILTARRSPWWARAVRWVLLLALIVGAGGAGVERAVHGYGGLSRPWLSGGVAAAPWVILAVAVWLWLSMIKQLVRLRRRDATQPEAPDPDREFIPGLGEESADTRPLPRPAAPRALAPGADAVRDRPREAAEPDQGPRSGAVPAEHGAPETDRDDRLPALSVPVAQAGGEPETLRDRPRDDRATPLLPPASQTGGEPETVRDRPRDDRATPLLPPTAETGGEPEPTIPPELERQADRAWQPGPSLSPVTAPDAVQGAAPETKPDRDPVPDTDLEVRVPVRPVDPEQEEPPPRWVARASLPTDVRLVGPPQAGPGLGGTHPDGIRLRDTDPNGIPMTGVADETAAGEEDDGYADDRAEDPDAGDVADDERPWNEPQGDGPWSPGAAGAPDDENVESTPPSSKFRSSPTPPRG